MNLSEKGLISIHLAVLLFGTAGLFGKFLHLSPVVIVFGRVAFATLFAGLYLLAGRVTKGAAVVRQNNKISDTLLIILLGVILSIHWITFFQAIQVSTVAIGLLAFSTFPIFVVFAEPLIFKTRFQIKYLYLTIISLTGIWLLVPEYRWENSYFQGLIWGIISGMLFAALTLINKHLTSKYKAITLAFYQNGISFLILLVPVTVGGLIKTVTPAEWLILMLLGVVFTAFSHTLFIYGLKTVKARTAGIIACMEPVYGILFAFWLLSEIPDLRIVIGGSIIVGVTLFLSIHSTM